MLDDLFEADNAAAARDLIARPLPASPKPAKFSAWSAIPRGVAVAAGEVGASLSDLAGAAIAFRDTPSKQVARGGLPTEAFSSELGDSVRDYWHTLTPDPETASTAEQVLFGFSRGLAKLIPATIAAGPAGAIAAGIEEAMTVSDDLRRQGVQDGPRQFAGIIQGTGMASAALPLLGRTLAETVALYVAGGPGGFMAQQALTRKVLERAGQETIADNYDPFDPVGLTVASAIPLAFTAAGLRAQKLRAEAKAQADFIAGPRPSEPTPVAAAVAEAVRAPEFPPAVVDAAMVDHLRVAGEVAQAEIPARVAEAAAEARSLAPEVATVGLSDVIAGWEARGIDASVSERSGVIELHKIIVPKDRRSGGVGTTAMQELVDYADRTGQRIELTPATDFGGSSVKRLVQFYKRFDFVENKGKNKDFTTRSGMIREAAPIADKVPAASVATDPIAKLNEPAAAPIKPIADPIHAAVAARVAELDPELVVRVDPDGRRVTLADDLAEVRRLAAEGTNDALGTIDADLLQVAVNCALSSGG